MARDYKHRVYPKKNKNSKQIARWKWLFIILLVAGFAYFLAFLNAEQKAISKKPQPHKTKPQQSKSKKEKQQNEGLRFDFYNILPEKEVIVGDYEVKTRIREEYVGKAKTTQYLLQAGSFKNHKEADRLKAQLALIGIESRIEKYKVGDIEWNRIKIGPFSKITSVENLRKRLRLHKIDVMVMEMPKR